MSKQTWIKDNGTWRKVKSAWANVNGIWKNDVMPKGVVSGGYKEFMQYYQPYIISVNEDHIVRYDLDLDGLVGMKRYEVALNARNARGAINTETNSLYLLYEDSSYTRGVRRYDLDTGQYLGYMYKAGAGKSSAWSVAVNEIGSHAAYHHGNPDNLLTMVTEEGVLWTVNRGTAGIHKREYVVSDKYGNIYTNSQNTDQHGEINKFYRLTGNRTSFFTTNRDYDRTLKTPAFLKNQNSITFDRYDMVLLDTSGATIKYKTDDIHQSTSVPIIDDTGNIYGRASNYAYMADSNLNIIWRYRVTSQYSFHTALKNGIVLRHNELDKTLEMVNTNSGEGTSFVMPTSFSNNGNSITVLGDRGLVGSNTNGAL